MCSYVAAGIFVKRPELIPRRLEKGGQYITCSTDVGMYADHSRITAQGLQQEIAHHQSTAH